MNLNESPAASHVTQAVGDVEVTEDHARLENECQDACCDRGRSGEERRVEERRSEDKLRERGLHQRDGIAAEVDQ